MATVWYEEKQYPVKAGESVLDTLLKNQIPSSYSCRSGVCQTCVMKADKGELPERAQKGLKDTLKKQGYFLSCVCYPEQDLHISSENNSVLAWIVDKQILSQDVVKINLRCSDKIEYFAGQYITLTRQDKLSRSYSLASLPEEETLEIHVRKLLNGKMSSWLYDEAQIGEQLQVQGPIGDCFYTTGQNEQPLLLAGTGTGLAPLYGILKDALKQGHQGDIWLFHGALHSKGLYLVDELASLIKKHANFHYCPTVLQGNPDELIKVGNLEEIIFSQFPKLSAWRAFLCGHPELVVSLKKKLFLKGVSLKNIFSDAFITSPSTSS